MKIRAGFVSNSSSSSFCLFGVALEKSKIEEGLDLLRHIDQDLDLEGFIYKKEKEDAYFQKVEFIDGLDMYYDSTVVGIGVHNLPRDKTLNEMTDELYEKLTELFDDIRITIEKKSINFISDGGYFG